MALPIYKPSEPRGRDRLFPLTCSIRYFRPGRPEDAGLLITKRAEFAAYKARLEAAGYVVMENLIPPPLEILAGSR